MSNFVFLQAKFPAVYDAAKQVAHDKPSDPDLTFATAHDVPVPYLQRTRGYYQALGYGAPYEWAHFAEVPFQRLRKPLSQCAWRWSPRQRRIGPNWATRDPARLQRGRQVLRRLFGRCIEGPRPAHFAPRHRPPAHQCHRPRHLLSARRIEACRRSRADRLGGAALPRHADESQPACDVGRRCTEIVERCKADGADAALLVANCPVCHQTMSLIARRLEANGIASVVVGCAKDIVEYVGVPRLLFTDFPLGNAAGRPHDPASQAFTLELALELLETAPAARTSVQSPLRWSDSATGNSTTATSIGSRPKKSNACGRVRPREGDRQASALCGRSRRRLMESEQSSPLHCMQNEIGPSVTRMTGSLLMRKTMSIRKTLCLFVAGLALSMVASAQNISIATGGTGGVYYPLGGGIAAILSKHVPGMQATAEVTGGSIDNLKLVGSGKSYVGFTMTDASQDAYRGEDKFKGNKIPLRTLMILYPTACTWSASKAAAWRRWPT